MYGCMSVLLGISNMSGSRSAVEEGEGSKLTQTNKEEMRVH